MPVEIDLFKKYSGQILLSKSGPSANLTATVAFWNAKHLRHLGCHPVQSTIRQKHYELKDVKRQAPSQSSKATLSSFEARSTVNFCAVLLAMPNKHLLLFSFSKKWMGWPNGPFTYEEMKGDQEYFSAPLSSSE